MDLLGCVQCTDAHGLCSSFHLHVKQAALISCAAWKQDVWLKNKNKQEKKHTPEILEPLPQGWADHINFFILTPG